MIAKGESVSIDAIRIELGNTGSKTTIHRYLKELEEEDSRRLSPVALSDELQELVGQVAVRLQQEAEEQIERIQHQHDEAIQQWQTRFDDLKVQLISSQAQVEELQAHASLLEQQRDNLQEAQQALKVQLAELSTQSKAQQSQLDDKDRQITSLEDKHCQARDSLEHYRESVKTQREQENRRHEQQVQHLQAEIRTINQTLKIKQQELTLTQKLDTEQATKLELLAEQLQQTKQALEGKESELLERRDGSQLLQARVGEQERLITTLQKEQLKWKESHGVMMKENQGLHLECAQLKASLAAHKDVLDKWFSDKAAQ